MMLMSQQVQAANEKAKKIRQAEFNVALESSPEFAKAWKDGLFLNFNIDGLDALEIWKAATAIEREKCGRNDDR